LIVRLTKKAEEDVSVSAYTDGRTEDLKNLPLTMTTCLALPTLPKKLHTSGETMEVARRCTKCQTSVFQFFAVLLIALKRTPSKTTSLYDWRDDETSLNEVQKIGI